MFNDTYKECFVECKVKKLDDETYILDLPFRITSHMVIYNGANYYHIIPQVDGATVLAHITYFASDDDTVKSFIGYIADNSTPEGRALIKEHELYPLPTIDELGNTVPFQCVFTQDDYEDK